MRTIAVSLIAKGQDVVKIKELEWELKTDNQFNAQLLNLLHDIPSFDLTISDWTSETQVFLKNRLILSDDIDFDIKTRSSKRFDKTILNEALKDHFKISSSDNSIPITTVHQVKGKTLDSILVFFNEKKHKDNITFSDISSSDKDFPSEKQRIIYVALSRPQHLLSMALPDTISEEELKAKFGDKICIVSNEEI